MRCALGLKLAVTRIRIYNVCGDWVSLDAGELRIFPQLLSLLNRWQHMAAAWQQRPTLVPRALALPLRFPSLRLGALTLRGSSCSYLPAAPLGLSIPQADSCQ